MVNISAYHRLTEELAPNNVSLVAVSKFKTAGDIKKLYDAGQKDFGENYVQELLEKQALLPADIHWHFIGHLQSNKVKYIVPFIYLIHGVDSFKLLKEINKQAGKHARVVNVLLQIHIAEEETKFGLDEKELADCFVQLEQTPFEWVRVVGLMGMSSFSEDTAQVTAEMHHLKSLHDRYKTKFDLLEGHNQPVLSMGMSGDYPIAIENGSNMVRVGSLLFGAR
ncbi:YggS family pyridoxal phosphate-dependent enzyme [Gynurincola endophyticus]|uniref:YggS family pyridoxal phosphate-dependent enzyme n=1 Tax=Gynurincola endophyticus TaxID=2479004 RepID=UPI000F8CC6B0|nr:YggS family pyridoxal phosphate-dependent enzyme [Gynurincola endophyticus]